MIKKYARPNSGSFKSVPLRPAPVTFEEWQAEQENDLRTPGQRGICVGSPVMWRRRSGDVIVTERATVTAISDHTLTLLVKDVEARTCEVLIHEIVSSAAEHRTLSASSRRAWMGSGVKPSQSN